MNGFVEVQSRSNSELLCEGLRCESPKYVVNLETGSLNAKELGIS